MTREPPAARSAATPSAEPGPSFLQLYRLPGATPLRVGAALTAAYAVAILALRAASGESLPPLLDDAPARVVLNLALLFGVLLAAVPHILAALERDLLALRAAAGPRAEDVEREARGRFGATPRGLATAGLAGAGVALLAFGITAPPLASLGPTGVLAQSGGRLLFLVVPLWATGAQGFYLLGRAALAFQRVGRHSVRIDLLDRSPLEPFSRAALRLVLFALIPGAIGLFNYAAMRFAPLPAVILGGTWATMAAFILTATTGVRAAIRREKAAEIARVDAALRGERAALARSPLAARLEQGSLADLLAWRAHVDSQREWIFDAAAIGRGLAYLAIPLVSWVGGSLVDRAMDRLLD